ncbi:UNVERIFIED_CONTAM: hypothetical protein RMT77_018636 [Armadillidium vulgare]
MNYGCTITQIIGGRLSEKYGPKWFFGSSISIPALFMFFIPLAAKRSFWAVVVIRFIQGLLQGFCWPSMFVISANWFPLNERSRVVGIIILGLTFGIVFIFPLTGFLSDILSWEIACYIIGTIPVVWGIFWSLLMHNKPRYHPRISEDEKDFLKNAFKEAGKSDNNERKIPWKSILTNLPMIALVFYDIGNIIGLTIYTSQIPNYLVKVYNLNFTKTGIISGLPFLCQYIGSCLFSSIADYFITKKIFTERTVRRLFSVIAMLFPSVLLLIVGLQLLKSVNEFLGVICLGLFFNGAISASQLVNYVDIAPNYAGTLFGICNTVSNATMFLSLLISGEILNAKGELHDLWSYVFFSAIPVMVGTEIFYLIFLKGEPQLSTFRDLRNESKQPNYVQMTLKI